MRPRAARLALVGLLALLAGCDGLPDPVYPVRDDVGALNPNAASRVREVCLKLERQTSAELGILIIATTSGRNHAKYALEVFNHWGVGKRGKNNGVLLLFAMEDRRVELVPGDGYRKLFSRSAVEAMLKRTVVPKMRAGKPAEAIEACAREVARWIREREGVEEARTAPTEGDVALSPERPTSEPEPAAFGGGGPRPEKRARRVSPRKRLLLWERFVVFGAVLTFVALLAWILRRTFKTGVLPFSRLLLWPLVFTVPILFLGLSAQLLPAWIEADSWGAGGSVVAAMVLGFFVRHVCPSCKKWCGISTRTLVHATYSSSGTGERTYHCSHCGYHHVGTYRIPRKQRSRSRSSSSGSFGGGSSSGGGGGASW